VDDFNEMNGVYAEYFQDAPPARTTVQPQRPGPRGANQKGHYPTLEQISVIAVK
jgi:enamine deaminase RidA (YjgF/YER057c/UK114 family)